MILRVVIYFAFLFVYVNSIVKAEATLDRVIKFFLKSLDDDQIIDYDEAYLLLPVILRNYNYRFPINDNELNKHFGFEGKVFCLNNDCFDTFLPNKKWIKNTHCSWKADTQNIDLRMKIASLYSHFKLDPPVSELMKYIDDDIYELTHAGFILFLIRQSINDLHAFKDWELLIFEKVHFFLNNREWQFEKKYFNTNLDVLLELFLVLELFNSLPERYFNELKSYELNNGGFSKQLHSCESSIHSSLIAAWILASHKI